VLEAASADEGIELLDHESTIRAVVSDIETPGRYDGFALAWHACMRHPATPVLLISGRTMAAEDELPGGARFLEKPVDPDQLVRELREALLAARVPSH
jgi:DNA-binding NtrC family response regulator